MLSVKNNIYLKILTIFLVCIFLFTFNLQKNKSVAPFLLLGGMTLGFQTCPVTYGSINYFLSPPIPLNVMQTPDSRARAFAWFGGFTHPGQWGLGTLEPVPVPCLFTCGPYICIIGYGWIPILQGTSV